MKSQVAIQPNDSNHTGHLDPARHNRIESIDFNLLILSIAGPCRQSHMRYIIKSKNKWVFKPIFSIWQHYWIKLYKGNTWYHHENLLLVQNSKSIWAGQAISLWELEVPLRVLSLLFLSCNYYDQQYEPVSFSTIRLERIVSKIWNGKHKRNHESR